MPSSASRTWTRGTRGSNVAIRALEAATTAFSTRWAEILRPVDGRSRAIDDATTPSQREAAALGPRRGSTGRRVVQAATAVAIRTGGVALLSVPELSTASLADSLRKVHGADVVVCDPSEKVQGQWLCTMTFAGAEAAPTQKLVAVHGDDDAERYFAVVLREDATGEKLIKQLRSAAAAQTFAGAGDGQIETVGWKLFGRLAGD